LISAGFLTLGNGGQINSGTGNNGRGGNIDITARDTISISGTFSDGSPVGFFSRSLGTEAGAGSGGNITLTTGQSVTISNGASVSASSTGPGNTGNIEIDAGNRFTMRDSSITTTATQAGGGTIEIKTNPGATIEIIDSLISASVLDGMGGGGSVNIDPLYFIMLNSQLLARAVQGPGGNISITSNFFLTDANSVISASSQFGVNGTVTIQSPNAPVSGQIQPLNKTPLLATSLLNQHCAALAGGQFSSFTVAGRDSLPTEPGNWLTSPLAMLGMEPRLKAEGGKAEGMSASAGQGARGESLSSSSGLFRASNQRNETNQINQMDQPVLSLRQIAPAGFLTQAFAVDRSAGCQS
jgi:large exoprotein involved in heme utilization and adhesion